MGTASLPDDVHACMLSRLSVTPWTIARQALLSLEFSRQKYWSGLPLSPPGDLPDPGIKPGSPTLQADSLLSELPGKSGVTGKAHNNSQEIKLESG